MADFITIFTFIGAIYVFLIDPIRRWQFFGFRPTVIAILFDPKLKKVLLIKDANTWEFIQGSMYVSDIYCTLEQTLKRETALVSINYKLVHVSALGTAKTDGKSR